MLVAVQAIVATGALYEILEWAISLTLAPDAVEAYNGQQGDMFDPQKDQALALLGSLLGSGCASIVKAIASAHSMAAGMSVMGKAPSARCDPGRR